MLLLYSSFRGGRRPNPEPRRSSEPSHPVLWVPALRKVSLCSGRNDGSGFRRRWSLVEQTLPIIEVRIAGAERVSVEPNLRLFRTKHWLCPLALVHTRQCFGEVSTKKAEGVMHNAVLKHAPVFRHVQFAVAVVGPTDPDKPRVKKFSPSSSVFVATEDKVELNIGPSALLPRPCSDGTRSRFRRATIS